MDGTYVPWRGREGGIYHCEIPDAMHVSYPDHIHWTILSNHG